MRIGVSRNWASELPRKPVRLMPSNRPPDHAIQCPNNRCRHSTDIDSALLARAQEACYKLSSLKELPAEWHAQAFEKQGALFCLREMFRCDVAFARQDLRSELPQRLHDVILCRNLAFTYFEARLANETLDRLLSRLRQGGALVVGLHDRLPACAPRLAAWPGCRATYRHERPP